jgi:amino acid transporter
VVHLIHHRDKERTDTDEHAGEHTGEHTDTGSVATGEHRARERFGGVNIGAAFAGWLVAIALTVLLSSILGAIASAIGATTDITQDQAEREAGAIGLAAAIAIVAVMMVAYYFGGYVAGRMSRFDGPRQGLATWLIGLVVTVAAVALGIVFGDQYNVMDRVDLPRIPIPTETATWGGIITGLALIVGTLLAAVAGGKVGHRYHNRVDRVAYH